ncbi:MAG TPA: TraR/DksA C4-type zinc finger protein [Gemmatimonadales bacterium]|jgi:hypothetical protein|nr:TraR/DksA C4-type zinc finger protein [Gemmatimonadales bacterium]
MTPDHLTPDELHELWNELRVELERIGGRSAWAYAGIPSSDLRSPWKSSAADPLQARQAGAPERLLRLLEALSRMRTGKYGVCQGCRNPIPYTRLLAIPETLACVNCSAAGAVR